MTNTQPPTQEVREADELLAKATTAALMSLVESGVSTDVQGLLLYGDNRGTVGPNALRKAMEAACLSVGLPALFYPPAGEVEALAK